MEPGKLYHQWLPNFITSNHIDIQQFCSVEQMFGNNAEVFEINTKFGNESKEYLKTDHKGKSKTCANEPSYENGVGIDEDIKNDTN